MLTTTQASASWKLKQIARELTDRGFRVAWENEKTLQAAWPVMNVLGKLPDIRLHEIDERVTFIIRFRNIKDGERNLFNARQLINFWHEVSSNSILYFRENALVLQAAYNGEFSLERFRLHMALLEMDIRKLLERMLVAQPACQPQSLSFLEMLRHALTASSTSWWVCDLIAGCVSGVFRLHVRRLERKTRLSLIIALVTPAGAWSRPISTLTFCGSTPQGVYRKEKST